MLGADPLLQQLPLIHAAEQRIGHDSYPAQVGRAGAHLGDGMVWIHRPHRLNAAAARITEEHRKRRHWISLRGGQIGPRRMSAALMLRWDDRQTVVTTLTREASTARS
ncbi:MAG: hypothetical protein EB072_19230, partial [Betaproteobacteria bacterium]|nr:hypothetical protein [Betaproteobacteria bacterium]